MKDISIRADRIWHRGVTDRGMIQVQPFRVDSKTALSRRIEVGTDTKLAGVSVHSVNSRAAGVNLPEVFDRHAGGLNLEPVIVDVRNSADVDALIVIEPTPVVF